MPLIPLPLPPDTYDAPWKGALAFYFADFLAFFFPDIHAAMDWSCPPAFLDKELQQLARDGAIGSRFADHLVQVRLLDGADKCLLLHIEVQATRDNSLPERMYVYQYRIYDRYRHPVICLAVLADRSLSWRPGSFSYRYAGCGVRLDFRSIKLQDYAGCMELLLTQENPFALLTAAHLLTQQTRHQPRLRQAAKWKLARLLFERAWDKQRVINLFHVIDWIMRLPKELEDELWQDIMDLQGGTAMETYVPRGARIAMMRELNEAREKAQQEGWLKGQLEGWQQGQLQGWQEGQLQGWQEGQLQGWQEGQQRGWQEGQREGQRAGQAALLSRLLTKRFGPLPEDVAARLAAADLDQLLAWAETALDAASVDQAIPRPQGGARPA